MPRSRPLPPPLRFLPLASLLGLAVAIALVGTAAPAAARTLKIATLVPEGSAWLVEMRRAGKEIEARTAGRVKLKFYPGGVMGAEKTVMRKIRAGQLHGGAFTSGALASLAPEIELYSLPLLFRSYDEIAAVRAQMDPELSRRLEKAGLVPLAIGDTGLAYLMSQKPLRRVEDLRGVKAWVVENDVMSETAFGLAGVSPVQIALPDVYTALQTGLIDTIASPPMGAIAFQWHTKVKYLTNVPLMYLIGIFGIDAKAFAALSSDDQKVLREIVAEAGKRLDAASRAGESEALAALVSQGIELVDAASPAELERWRDIGRQSIEKLRALGRYDASVIDAIIGHLEQYRKAAGAAGGG